MRAPIRLLLVAGAAATTALLLRDPLATHLGRSLAAPVGDLAAATQAIRPVSVTLHVPPRAEAASPIVPILPADAPPPAPAGKPATNVPAAIAPKSLPAATAPTTKVHVVTRAELEGAIASRLSGACAALVRDEEGRPAGLALHGVGALARFGVRDGDVLVSANGLSLRTPDEALAALGALEHATRVVVTLRRGGVAYSVPVELADD